MRKEQTITCTLYGTVMVQESGQVKLATVTNNNGIVYRVYEHCEIWRALGPPYRLREVIRGTAGPLVRLFTLTRHPPIDQQYM